MYSFLNSYLLLSYADISLEEDEFDIFVLPIEETYTPLLLLHPVLHHTTLDHVHTRV